MHRKDHRIHDAGCGGTHDCEASPPALDRTRLVYVGTGEPVDARAIAMDAATRLVEGDNPEASPHYWKPEQFKKNGHLRIGAWYGNEVGVPGWGNDPLSGAVGFYDAEREAAAATMRGIVALREVDLRVAQRKLDDAKRDLLSMYRPDRMVQVDGEKPVGDW